MRKLYLLFTFLIGGTWAFAQQDSLNMKSLAHRDYLNDLNDIWGYADNGREFALVGVQNGTSIVEIDTSNKLTEKHFIPGATSVWRDIKTWSHYAYVVHDYYAGPNSEGITIIDLSTVDSANISITQVYPQDTVQGSTVTFDRAHNIYIDENGVLYVFGSNIGNGGALMFDVATDPTDPQLLGRVSNNYYHDGMARGDTLYGAAINAGQFEVVDVSNKSNPVVLATQSTPYTFCHNVWVSDNSQVLFTTDEKSGAPIASYDISDLNNITFLDTIRTSLSEPMDVIPHNTHVLGDFLVNSYYTSGLQLVDASQPDILVETAYYDSSPADGDGFSGAWGAYPYLPSKRLLISDINTGLWVIDTDFPRAAFLTVLVIDSVSNSTLANASIDLLSSTIGGKSNIFGNFRAGQRDTGSYQLVVSKSGYETDTVQVRMQAGNVAVAKVALVPVGFGLEVYNPYGLTHYPQPTQGGNFKLMVPHEVTGDLQAGIYDQQGRELRRIEGLHNGVNDITTNLKTGIYFIQVKSSDKIIAHLKLQVGV